MASSTDHGFFRVVGSNPTIHNNKLFQAFPIMSNLINTLPGIPRKRNRVDVDRSACMSGRPAIPTFQGRREFIRLSLGKLLVITFCKWSNGLIPHY